MSSYATPGGVDGFVQMLSPERAKRDKLAANLRAARIMTPPEVYLKASILAGWGGAVTAALGAGAFGLAQGVSPIIILLLACAAGLVVFGLVKFGFDAFPGLRSTSRARHIEAEYPSAIILCYALARGGLNAIDVFRALRDERETYGEISREFGVVVRDIEWSGKDINAALQDAAALTPSRSLQSFFTGLVSILNSGADPREYFKRQAEMQLNATDVRVESELEQAGLLAEGYVSGLLVLPLLLIIVIAVLSVFSGGKDGLLKAIVFIFIPIGSVAYLVLVDMLLPAEALAAPPPPKQPLADFGLDVATARRRLGAKLPEGFDDPEPLEGAAAGETWKGRFKMATWKMQIQWQRFVAGARLDPTKALPYSLALAFLVIAVGGSGLWSAGHRGYDLMRNGTSIAILATLVAVIPVAVFHEMRANRARKLDASIPETLSKLSGFNERGITILQAFQILGRSAHGPMAKELRALDRDVSWNRHLRTAISRWRARVGTPRSARLGILLERASAATGDLKEVLDVAGRESNRSEGSRARKRQGMMTYVVVIYVVFAVFLYVAYTISNLFYGPSGFDAVAVSGTTEATALGEGLAAEAARMLFFHAVLIQGACCGMVAGRLGEGYFLSGLKHAAILGTLAWAVFTMGVL